MIGRLAGWGLAGTVLLAIGGWLAGARPGPAPTSQAEALWGTTVGFRFGLLAYLAGLVLLGWAWWRLGNRLTAEAGLTTRRLLAIGALWATPLLVAPPLGSRDLYAYACQGAIWLDGHDPYAVGAAAGGCPWLATVPPLWQETTTPYGPLALVTSAVAVAVARALADGLTAQLWLALLGLRVVALVGAVLVAAALPRLARACRVSPRSAVWLGLITPLVAVHVVAGGHNDALVAGLVVVALAAVAGTGEGRPGWRLVGFAALAGLALGLAAGVKVTALAALPFGLLLAARRGWPLPAVLLAAGGAGFGGLTLLTGLGWGWTEALVATGALAQWTSLPTGLGMAAGYLLWGLGAPGAFDSAVVVARLVGLAGLAGLSVGLWAQAWRRVADTRAVVLRAGAVLAAVVVLGPVVYPWYAVVPLAVLAAATVGHRPRWWLAVATLSLTALTLPSGLGVPVLTKFPGALAVAAATVAVSWWWLRRRRVAAAATVDAADQEPAPLHRRADPAG